jgi:hypothetical protein
MGPDTNDADGAAATAGTELMTLIARAHPEFEPRWKAHLADWGDDDRLPYIDISQYAHFIDEELFEEGHADRVRTALNSLEEFFLQGDEYTRDLIAIGFIEDLQNYTTSRPDGHDTVLALLPPILTKVWKFVDSLWAGKSNLAEVLEAESATDGPKPSWNQVLNLSE